MTRICNENQEAPRRYVYGPVLSRRFGLSLGVDLFPGRCCFDCVYCQAGRTRELEAHPSAGPDIDRVVAEVEAAVAGGLPLKTVTFAGSGEPTLFSGLGELCAELRRRVRVPLLLITNAGLLWQQPVRERVQGFDMVAPSLDAGLSSVFAAIKRPEASLEFHRVVEGLQVFCREYPGRVFLEVMLVRGMNDSTENLAALKAILDGLEVDSIDVNTPIRPGPDGVDLACPQAFLKQAEALFGPRAREIAYAPVPVDTTGLPARFLPRVLETIARRPSNEAELALACGLAPRALAAAIAELMTKGQIGRDGRGRYFVLETAG